MMTDPQGDHKNYSCLPLPFLAKIKKKKSVITYKISSAEVGTSRIWKCL